MASVIKQPKGRKWIQFFDKNNKHQTIRLSKCSMREAEGAKLRIEKLAGAQMRNEVVDRETIVWTQSLTDEHFKQALIKPETEPEAVNSRTKQKPKQRARRRAKIKKKPAKAG